MHNCVTQPTSGGGGGKTKRPDRPLIEAYINDSDWALFEDGWKCYKVMAGLNGREWIRMELRAACSTDVNKLLFEFVGPEKLDAASEEDLLVHIKSIAVKGVHKENYRMKFGKMKQSNGESVTHYVTGLKAQTALCEFKVNCDCHQQVSFAEEMVAQQLVAGLRDQDHQAKILAEASTLATLELKVKRLQSLEATEESASKLRVPLPSVSAAAKSAFQRSKRTSEGYDAKKNIPQGEKCRGCGRTSHGRGRTLAKKDCPAQGKKCLACGVEGHFRAACQKSKASKGAAVSSEQYQDAAEPELLHEEESNVSSSFFFATHPENSQASQDFRWAKTPTPDG